MLRDVATGLSIIAGLATCGLVGWRLAIIFRTMSSYEFVNVTVDGATILLSFSDSEYRSYLILLEPWIWSVLAAFLCVLAAFCWACVARFWKSRGTSR